VRAITLTGYYLAILVAVFILATLNAFSTPSFVYQGF
jgi:hypothetical protein